MSNNSYMNKLYKNVNSGNVSNSVKKNISTSKVVQRVSGSLNIIGTILITLAIVVAIYYITKQVSKNDKLNPTLIPGTLKMDELGEYNGALPLEGEGQLYIGEGVSLSYSLWVYVSDWTTGEKKNTIFRRGYLKTPDINESSLQIDYNTNSLVVNTRTNTTGSPSCPNHSFDVSGFPLQKWNHIVYVLNGTFIDIYLNGKLRKSVLFREMETLGSNTQQTCHHGDKDSDKLYVDNEDAYSGHISKFRYYSRAILPTDVIDLYNDGPL
jgi:hypothetical protein